MIEILATLLVGTGLFFLGMETLNVSIRRMAGRQFRERFKRWTNSRLKEVVSGFLLGAMTHSGSSAASVVTNVVVGRLISLRKGFIILAAANVGTVLLVLLVNVNIKLLIMLLLGSIATLYGTSHKARTRPVVAFLLGVGLMLFGLNLLETGAEHLIEDPAVHHALVAIQGSWTFFAVLLVSGFALRLVARSTSTVAILALALGHAGVLDFQQMGFLIVGSPLGAAFVGYFEMKEYRGSVKQLPCYQMLFEIAGFLFGAAFLKLQIFGELLFGGDNGAQAAEAVHSGAGSDAVMAMMLLTAMRLAPFLLTLAFSQPLSRWLERLFPVGDEEILSTPVYIYDQALEDPETAMDLIVQEQQRLAERFVMLIDHIREEGVTQAGCDFETLHSATEKLQVEVARFIKEMLLKDLSRKVSERLLKLDNVQDLIHLIEENLYHLIREIQESKAGAFEGKEAVLFANLAESSHAVLSLCIEASLSNDQEDLADLIRMTSDKGRLMESIRERYLVEDASLTPGQKKSILMVTDLYQRMIWLLNKWMLQVRT